MEIGIYTFGEVDPQTGDAGLRLRQLVAEMELADRVGLDVYAIGEHHRADYAVSAPAVVLAAGAARTERIRLSSAVTVLSSDDPVRVFQQFATLDGLSNGRAEIMAGRGSFVESFPLFGYALEDYETLFSENLELLVRLRDDERITWPGGHRAAIDDRPVYPRPVQERLPIWRAVGGSPQSVMQAAAYGLPLALAIIGGRPAQFKQFTDLYRAALQQAGHDPATPVSINSHGFLADTRQEALDTAYPAFAATMNRIGRERGWAPMSRAQFDASTGLHGANFVGSPDDVIEKILHQHAIFGHDRFLLQLSVGPLPHEAVLHAIDLLGTQVAPVVRREVAKRKAAGTVVA